MIKPFISVTRAASAASSIAFFLICLFAVGFNSSAKASGEGIALISNEVESLGIDSNPQNTPETSSQVAEPVSQKKEPEKQEENEEDNPQVIDEKVTENGEVIDITSQVVGKEDASLVEDPEKIWEEVEVKPEFPGGDAALYKFLSDHMTYPYKAAKKNIQGTVVVGFVIEKDGLVTNVEVIRGKHRSLDKEAVRVVKLFPKFIPGKNNGEPVRVACTLPIRFRLS